MEQEDGLYHPMENVTNFTEKGGGDKMENQYEAFGGGNYPVTLGRQVTGTQDWYHFNGFIDEVKIWNYTRTPSQIQNDMN